MIILEALEQVPEKKKILSPPNSDFAENSGIAAAFERSNKDG